MIISTPIFLPAPLIIIYQICAGISAVLFLCKSRVCNASCYEVTGSVAMAIRQHPPAPALFLSPLVCCSFMPGTVVLVKSPRLRKP